MTEKLTWAEFVEKYKPVNGDKFLDERGNEWHYRAYGRDFCCETVQNVVNAETIGKLLTCPLIPPKKKRKLWPAIIRLKSSGLLTVGGVLHSSEQSAKEFEGEDFHSWPAIPGPDGSYEVAE